MQNENWLRQLQQRYPTVKASSTKADGLVPFERSFRSPGGEDGVLLELFAAFGAGSHTLLELGCANVRDSNCACLLLDFDWKGVMVDANAAAVESGRRFLSQNPGASRRVELVAQPVTPANVNSLLSMAAGGADRLDLLSLDIDGNDYHIFNAIERPPRLAVVEYNPSLGPERQLTVPYTDGFNRHEHGANGWYHGASLAALAAGAERKNLALLGCDSRGTNAFFMDAEELSKLADECFPALGPEEAWQPNTFRRQFGGWEQQWKKIEALNWQEV